MNAPASPNAHDDPPALELHATPRPRLASLLGACGTAVAILAALFLLGFIPLRRRHAELLAESERAKTSLPIVNVVQANRSTKTTEMTLPGTVRAFQQTEVNARTNGYVKRSLVDLGDEVKAGQLLAEIEVPELDQELGQARATLKQLEARVAVAQANVELTDSTLKRYEAVAPVGGITLQELAERRAGTAVARCNVEAAKADLAAGEANVRRLTELKSFADVAAPFTGTITARWVEVGTLVTAGAGRGQALYRIAQSNPARVFVNVPQALAPAVTIGSKARVLARELPDGELEGTVTRTSRAIDDASRTLLAEIDVPNAKGLLLAGAYTRVKFSVSHGNPVLLIPESALVVNANGTQVATVVGDKIQLKPVRVETDFGSTVGLASGLEPDDLVVTNPSEKTAHGTTVTVRRAK